MLDIGTVDREQTARRMLKNYGRERALEFADTYAMDARGIYRDVEREEYWRGVETILKTLPGDDDDRH